MHSELAYTRKGSGEPLVLIHGIGHRRQAWDPVFERLAESYDVIAVDLAGFGESAAYPRREVQHAQRVDNLTDNFAAWGVEKPHVVGNSLGGALALELGARGAVSSVTALSPAGFFGVVNRVQTFVLLIMLRISSKLPDRVLPFVSQKAGDASSPARSTTTPSGSPLTRCTATRCRSSGTGFERTILAGARYHFVKLRPGADDDRVGHARPDPPVQLSRRSRRSACPMPPRRAPALRSRADDRRSRADRPRHREHHRSPVAAESERAA